MRLQQRPQFHYRLDAFSRSPYFTPLERNNPVRETYYNGFYAIELNRTRELESLNQCLYQMEYSTGFRSEESEIYLPAFLFT
jgi:hypothetical protein